MGCVGIVTILLLLDLGKYEGGQYQTGARRLFGTVPHFSGVKETGGGVFL